MEEVRAFVETSWKGPARQDGVAAWLVECVRHGEPITRQGFVHLEAGTEAQATLMALANAFHILRKPCRVLICTPCRHVSATVRAGWHVRWQAGGWENAKGRPVRNAGLWEAFMREAGPHSYTAGDGRNEYASVMRDAAGKELERWKGKEGRAGCLGSP